MPDTRRVTVARAALMEVGRPDLAAGITANRRGDPCLPNPRGQWDHLTLDDRRLLARAFGLGHRSDPDGAPVGCGLPATMRGSMSDCLPGDDCPHCVWPAEWLGSEEVQG